MPQEEWDAMKFIARIQAKDGEDIRSEIEGLTPEQLHEVIDILAPTDTRLKKSGKGLLPTRV